MLNVRIKLQGNFIFFHVKDLKVLCKFCFIILGFQHYKAFILNLNFEKIIEKYFKLVLYPQLCPLEVLFLYLFHPSIRSLILYKTFLYKIFQCHKYKKSWIMEKHLFWSRNIQHIWFWDVCSMLYECILYKCMLIYDFYYLKRDGNKEGEI